MSAKPKMGESHPHLPAPHGFADNLESLRAQFPNYPDCFDWKLKKKKRLASVETEDPIATATLFAGLASDGCVSEVVTDVGYRRILADGTVVVLRVVTSSEGSPAVDLNIAGESYIRKIHFYKGES